MVTVSYSLFSSHSISICLHPHSSNMHSCSVTGRFDFVDVLSHSILRVWIHCAARVLLPVWIHLGLCSLCVCAVPAAAQSGADCVWSACDKTLGLRVWLPLGPVNTLHLNLCVHAWQCNLISSPEAWEKQGRGCVYTLKKDRVKSILCIINVSLHLHGFITTSKTKRIKIAKHLRAVCRACVCHTSARTLINIKCLHPWSYLVA